MRVQRELVEPHRAHERYVGGLEKWQSVVKMALKMAIFPSQSDGYTFKIFTLKNY